MVYLSYKPVTRGPGDFFSDESEIAGF